MNHDDDIVTTLFT